MSLQGAGCPARWSAVAAMAGQAPRPRPIRAAGSGALATEPAVATPGQAGDGILRAGLPQPKSSQADSSTQWINMYLMRWPPSSNISATKGRGLEGRHDEQTRA